MGLGCVKTLKIGQKRQIRDVLAMSASLPTPDILLSRSKRRSGPGADIEPEVQNAALRRHAKQLQYCQSFFKQPATGRHGSLGREERIVPTLDKQPQQIKTPG
jgi:hypothetical protein